MEVRERIYMLAFVCGLVLCVFVLLGIGFLIWPYRNEISTVFYVLILAGSGFLVFELFSRGYHNHKMRAHERDIVHAQALRAYLHSQVIEAANLAAYVNKNGTLYHLSAYEENAKIYPVEQEETTLEIAEEVKRLSKEQHLSERAIAGRLNLSRPQVRTLLGKPRTPKDTERGIE